MILYDGETSAGFASAAQYGGLTTRTQRGRMGKQKRKRQGKKRTRKLSAAEKAAKRKRREEYETIFIRGKMKRVRRPPTIEGMSVAEFIEQNADPIWLHQEGMWDVLEARRLRELRGPHPPVTTAAGRERVSFITTERGEHLVVAFAIALEGSDETASLILHRIARHEAYLPPRERGVTVSHELYEGADFEFALEIGVNGPRVDIQTSHRSFHLDISGVEAGQAAAAREVLRAMHRLAGFRLDLRDG